MLILGENRLSKGYKCPVVLGIWPLDTRSGRWQTIIPLILQPFSGKGLTVYGNESCSTGQWHYCNTIINNNCIGRLIYSMKCLNCYITAYKKIYWNMPYKM